jgi:hypothetical protein
VAGREYAKHPALITRAVAVRKRPLGLAHRRNSNPGVD